MLKYQSVYPFKLIFRLAPRKGRKSVPSKYMFVSGKRIDSLIIVFLHLLFPVGIVVSAQFKMILSCHELQTCLLKNCREVSHISYLRFSFIK